MEGLQRWALGRRRPGPRRFLGRGQAARRQERQGQGQRRGRQRQARGRHRRRRRRRRSAPRAGDSLRRLAGPDRRAWHREPALRRAEPAERPAGPQLPLLALARGRLPGRQLRLGHPRRIGRLHQLTLRPRGLLRLAAPLGPLAALADDAEGLPDHPRLRLLAQPVHRQPDAGADRLGPDRLLRPPDLTLALDSLRRPRWLGPLQRSDPAKDRRDDERHADGAGDDARRAVDHPLAARERRAPRRSGQQRLDGGGLGALLGPRQRPDPLLQRGDGRGLEPDNRGPLLRHGLLRRALVHERRTLPRRSGRRAQRARSGRRFHPAAARQPAEGQGKGKPGTAGGARRPLRRSADHPPAVSALQPRERPSRQALGLLQRHPRRSTSGCRSKSGRRSTSAAARMDTPPTRSRCRAEAASSPGW